MSEQRLVRFDWAMKHLLRNKANYDIVEGFLCALLDDNAIQVVEVLESETNADYDLDKFNRVDVLVKDAKGRNIIIEIQNTRESDYFYRMLYYSSKNITQSIELGDKYHKINKVISVNILYFDLGIGEDYIYHGKTEFHGLNSREIIGKDHEKVQKLIPKGAKHNAIEIFPEYYLIQVEKYQNVVSRAIDEWVYWFKNDKIKEGSTSKNIKKVEKKLNLLKMSREEREDYQTYLGKIASLRDMFETSREEGREQGREEGREEGREQGREETEKTFKPIIEQKEQELKQKEQEVRQKEQELKQKEQETLDSARAMLKAGLSIEQIQEFTKLSLEVIKKL